MLPKLAVRSATVRKSCAGVFLFVLIFSVFLLGASGQELTPAKPETVGLSSERLNRIGDAVQRSIDEKRIAGAVTMVVRRGHIAWFKAQGMADREVGKPMQTDAIFRICSMTKPLTTLAVMMLYEEGRFMLDDPVSKYIPELRNPKVLVKPKLGRPYTIPASREITIRDLLMHTSGMTYPWNPDLGPLYKAGGVADGLSQYDGTIADNVKRLAAQPLLFNPGERFEYGLGIDVLGYLVEVVSGKPLDEFFRTRIFEPLGMRDTYFYLPDAKVFRLATAYTWDHRKRAATIPGQRNYRGQLLLHRRLPISRTEETLLRRRRSELDGQRLCALLPDAARWRQGWGCPTCQPQDDRDDDA